MLELMAHQARAVDVAREHARYAFLWDCGTGKTIATLAIIASLGGKTLVLAPKSILDAAWKRDAELFPALRTVVCWSSKKSERLKLIASDADVLITNFETFKTHQDEFLRAGVKRLVIDESSKVKNHGSQISKAAHAFSDRMESVYLLSGTPAPNDRTEYWSQMRCLGRHVFGDSFYRFAATYFVPIRRTIQGKERVIGYVPAASKEQEFFDRLQSHSWSLGKTDCVDLPEQQDVMRPVELSDDEFTAYHTMLNECRAELRAGTLNASASARMMKLRQITGGAIYSGDRGVAVLGTSKLDALCEVLDEIGSRPVVVWAEFSNEIDRITERMYELKKRVDVIDGRANERGAIVDRFQRGEIDVLICQPAAAGHGITLTASSYAIYYSHGFSFETYKQSRDRIHRTGQKHPCTYYHLIANRTVDERVLRALGSKRDAHDEVMELLSTED